MLLDLTDPWAEIEKNCQGAGSGGRLARRAISHSEEICGCCRFYKPCAETTTLPAQRRRRSPGAAVVFFC